jgi:hypothetical protein
MALEYWIIIAAFVLLLAAFGVASSKARAVPGRLGAEAEAIKDSLRACFSLLHPPAPTSTMPSQESSLCV